MEYSVDKNVPVPPRSLADAMPLETLKLNESIAFPIEERGTVATRASRLKKTKDMWFTIQKMDDATCRIWRVK